MNKQLLSNVSKLETLKVDLTVSRSTGIQQESDTRIFTTDLLELDIHMYVLD